MKWNDNKNELESRELHKWLQLHSWPNLEKIFDSYLSGKFESRWSFSLVCKYGNLNKVTYSVLAGACYCFATLNSLWELDRNKSRSNSHTHIGLCCVKAFFFLLVLFQNKQGSTEYSHISRDIPIGKFPHFVITNIFLIRIMKQIILNRILNEKAI